MVESHCIYNNLVTQQTSKAIKILLPKFLNEVNPSNIVEIGTASGGLTHFLSDTCPTSSILTIEKDTFYNYKFKQNVTSIIGDSNSIEFINNTIIPFIQNDGTSIIFCDGGNKIIDFINYAPIIKKGDYICVHDYCKDRKIFRNKYYNKIWNYCRLVESDISGICDEYGLVNVYDELETGMWRVKMKISNQITYKQKTLI
jgi:precorrin-6B methylase 2